VANRVNIASAERFVLANGRLLDRHRLAVLLHDAPVAPVLQTLRAYRNLDGGFGHALEPDVRAPDSEPAATLHALEVLAEIDALDDPMVAEAAAWIATIANADGGLPFVLPTAAAYPHAPWMAPSPEGSHLTFAIAARLRDARSTDAWLPHATEWCWTKLENADELGGYLVKFALEFLDAVPDERRAAAAIETLRPQLSADGSLPVEGGTADERLTPLTLSPRPGLLSRALFSAEQINGDLDALERAQASDGGWTFDWLAWSEGQSVEWRGALTLRALATLGANDRIDTAA
jgi:hypothetical protein